MRVMLDTNVIISGLVLDSIIINQLLQKLSFGHLIFVCQYSINELYDISINKFKISKNVIDNLFMRFNYTLLNIKVKDYSLFNIRDKNDYVIVYTAIKSNMDVLISGDKDILSLSIDKPLLLSPREFLDKF